jgi:hypothetical protein
MFSTNIDGKSKLQKISTEQDASLEDRTSSAIGLN